MKPITAYFSHNIRGAKGNNATREDMKLNCDIAIMVSQALQNALPALELYVPAVHDESITELFLARKLDDVSILNADKKILGRRDILIAFEYHGVRSGGMEIERAEAKKLGIPVFDFNFVDEVPDLVARIIEWHYYRQREITDDE